MILLTLFAFIAGIVTVLSPCILPLLPVILSSSDSSGKRKPIGVVVGFVASFTFFTLFLSTIVRATGIAADTFRLFSIATLTLLGLSIVIPRIHTVVEIWLSRLSARAPQTTNAHGFWGGVLVGLSLGILWTPCVGPILASVITLAVTGAVTVQAAIITGAYALGTALPLFLIMQMGSTALQKVPWLVRNTASIQKAFGILMILTAIAIYFQVDRYFQVFILETFPNYAEKLTRFENTELIDTQLQNSN